MDSKSSTKHSTDNQHVDILHQMTLDKRIKFLVTAYIKINYNEYIPTAITNLVQKYIAYDYDLTIHSKTELYQYQYMQIYTALHDLKQYNENISIPEFLFICSDDKRRVVEYFIGLALGEQISHINIPRYRCPFVFKLINNTKHEIPLIKVNGMICKHQHISHKIHQITDELEEKDIISKDAIEIHIESSQAFEITFIDLPPLLYGDKKQFRYIKQQSEDITAHYLYETNADGTYRYMPILVRIPMDIECGTPRQISYIDMLIDKYGQGQKKRIKWKQDTLFIVENFSRQINRSPASSLIEYMKYLCEYGQTVIIMNRIQRQNIYNMNRMEYYKYLLSLEHHEEKYWNAVFSEFNKIKDNNINKLRDLKKQCCGINKMKQLLMNKIVNKINIENIENIKRYLDVFEVEKRNEISAMAKQISLSDHKKLKSKCIAFSNKFLKVSK
eukprot:462890_1